MNSEPTAGAAGAAALREVTVALRRGRDELLRDWVERVRDNRAVETGQTMSDPLLMNHMPRLYEAMLDRLELDASRDEAEQHATVHGLTRRVSGYDVQETVVELFMFRRAIWTHVSTIEAPVTAAYAVMERIDGMLDRAVVASLRAFLDPEARMLKRKPLDASGSSAVGASGVGPAP